MPVTEEGFVILDGMCLDKGCKLSDATHIIRVTFKFDDDTGYQCLTMYLYFNCEKMSDICADTMGEVRKFGWNEKSYQHTYINIRKSYVDYVEYEPCAFDKLKSYAFEFCSKFTDFEDFKCAVAPQIGMFRIPVVDSIVIMGAKLYFDKI